MLRLVAYDISNPRTLRRAANVCLDYGIRIEKSVFECDLASDAFEALWNRLCALVDEETDALVCYPVCAACEKRMVRHGRAFHKEPSEIRVF